MLPQEAAFGLPDGVLIRRCLIDQVGAEIDLSELESPVKVLRQQGGVNGLVVAELLSDAHAALDGFVVVDGGTASSLALGRWDDEASDLATVELEALRELCSAIAEGMNDLGWEHWIVGRITREGGAQALDPQLATARGVRAWSLPRPGAAAGLLAIVLGPALDAAT